MADHGVRVLMPIRGSGEAYNASVRCLRCLLCLIAIACGPRVAPAPPPPEPRETPPEPPPAEPLVGEATPPPTPAAQQARRAEEDRILAELEQRKVPLMEVPWTPPALQRSTKWAGVQYVRVEPASPPMNLGPLVIAPFRVELRASVAGLVAVLQGLAAEAQPGEVRELAVSRDPSDGMLLTQLLVNLYARDPEMRGADEARLAEARRRAQAIQAGIRAPVFLAVQAALFPGMLLEAYDQHGGSLSVTVSGREADAQPFAARLGELPGLADVRLVGVLSEGKGKTRRSRVMLEAKLR